MEEKIAAFLKEGHHTTTGKRNLKRILCTILSPSNVFDENSAKWLKILIAGGLSPRDFFKKLHIYDSALVCGLVWNANFFAYRCRDCGISPCMSLCADCFLAGNHKGHDFNMFKSQAGGACDCGDETVLKKEGFCPTHGKKNQNPRSVPDDLVALARIIIPEMVICLYKKVKSQWDNEAGEGVLNSSAYLLNILSEFSKIDALRSIVSHQITATIECEVLQNDMQSEISELMPSQITNNRLVGKTLAEKEMHTDDISCKPEMVDFQRHVWHSIEDFQQTYLHFFMDLLVKTEFPNKLATFLLQLLPISDYKNFFTKLFCRQYTTIGKLLTASVNPGQFSSRMVHVSVQLFSNESLAYKMVKEENLLTRIIFVLHKMIGQCLDYFSVDFEGITRSILVVDCDNKVLSEHCYWPIASDLTNILSHLSIAKIFLESTDCLNQWLYFVKMLAGMNVNKRRFLVHAEFESKSYYSAFSIEFECVASVMWELYRAIDKLNNKTYVVRMIEATLSSLDNSSLIGKLKKTSFTFHLTVHRHLALFIHQLFKQRLLVFLLSAQSTVQNFKMAIQEFNDTSVLPAIDHIKSIAMSYLINLLVSVEEIRAGFWRFNGHQITCQAQSYMQSCFCNSMLDLDIFLLQIFVSRHNADDFVEMLVDRFSLRPWLHFFEKNNNTDNTDENYLPLVQGFLNIIHMLLAHRVYSGLSEDELLRKDMIANLCVADRTHSQLTDIVPTRPANTYCSYKHFDQLLAEVADYKPPVAEKSGLQQGVYVPKDKVWENEYDYIHIYMRVFKKSDQQHSLERYNKVMTKKYCSPSSYYWPPAVKLPKIHSAYEGLFKLFRSKKLQQILIFIAYKIQQNINTIPEMLLISTVHLLQIFAENTYVKEDCASQPDVEDQVIDLVVKYVDCYHKEEELSVVSKDLKEVLDSSDKREIWAEELYRNNCEDLLFNVFLIYKSELIVPLNQYIETLVKKTSPASTLLHLRSLLSQLSYKKLVLLKRFIQYFYYYCKKNRIEVKELPFIGEEDVVTAQVITLLFDHFNFLFQIGVPLKHFPVEAYDIKLPHLFLYDNANVTFNHHVSFDNLEANSIDYISKNIDSYSLKQRSKSDKESIEEPMDISENFGCEKLCLINNQYSLLTILIKLHNILSERSKFVNKSNEDVVAGDGVFYTERLLKTFFNKSKLNAEFLKAMCPEVFALNASTKDVKSLVEDAKLERRRKVNERRLQLLEEFASQQKKFLNSTLAKSSSTDSSLDVTDNNNVFECVICFQSTESTEKRPIGLVVLLHPSSVLAHRTSQFTKDQTCGDLVRQREIELAKVANSGLIHLALETGTDIGINVQSCGHFVHIDCQQAYFQSLQDDHQILLNTMKGEFLCPLCRGFSNDVLPILPECIKEVSDQHKPDDTFRSLNVFEEQVAQITNMLVQMPKFSSLRRRALDVSVLTASTSLFYNSLEELTKSHILEKTYQGDKFAVLIATVRHNLEETMMNTTLLKELPEQKRKCLLKLLEFSQFYAQSLPTPMSSLWMKLTCGISNKNEWSYQNIPFLLMDPISLLIQFVITWPYQINSGQLYCLIQLLYNLTYTQALLFIGLKVKPHEKESWYRDVKKSDKEVTLNTLVNLVWKCSSMLDASEASSDEMEITLSVLSPQSLEHDIQQHCLHFLKTASFFLSIFLGQHEVEMDSKNPFFSYASLLKLGDGTVGCIEDASSTLFLKWCSHKSAICVITSWCEELADYLFKKKVDFPRLLPIANDWKLPSLIRLPLLFDSLFQEYRKQKCGRCKKIPEDPTLCLVCGRFLCFHSSCCIYDEVVYECVQHSSDCGCGTGLFLVISSSVTLVIRDERVCLWGSVYLDSFGEEDRDLKRGKPLFLSQDRYSKLETEWRTHTLDKASKHWRLHLNRL